MDQSTMLWIQHVEWTIQHDLLLYIYSTCRERDRWSTIDQRSIGYSYMSIVNLYHNAVLFNTPIWCLYLFDLILMSKNLKIKVKKTVNKIFFWSGSCVPPPSPSPSLSFFFSCYITLHYSLIKKYVRKKYKSLFRPNEHLHLL
jgi:hypothetical protein